MLQNRHQSYHLRWICWRHLFHNLVFGMTLHGQILGQNLIPGHLGKVSEIYGNLLCGNLDNEWPPRHLGKYMFICWEELGTCKVGNHCKRVVLIRSRTNPGSAWSCDFLAEIQRDKPIAFFFCSNLVTIKETLWLSQSTSSPLFRCCLASKMKNSVTQFIKKPCSATHKHTHTHNINIIIMRGRFAYILQIYSERFPKRWSSFQPKRWLFRCTFQVYQSHWAVIQL